MQDELYLEYKEVRRFEVSDIVIEVKTNLGARKASEELVYLVKELAESIKDINGINALIGGIGQDQDTNEEEVQEHNRDTQSKGAHSRNRS
jgi:hypothetical protein